MADANDVSFNLIPDEERPYNSNWDRTLKETFRATERDTQGWSDLGATGLKARENGRSDAGNEADGSGIGSTRSQSRENGRGVTPENGPIGTDDDHNPYGWLSLGPTRVQPRGAGAESKELDKLRASRRQPDLQKSNRPDDLRASRQAGDGRASRKDNLRETKQAASRPSSDSETSGPSVDNNSHWRPDIGASGNNVASSGRGLRRTDISPMRQTVLSTVTERTEDDVIRRTRDSALPARDPVNPGWRTMIVEGDYLSDWKNMFNKMTPRWRTRESVTHSSVTRSWKTYDDDTIDDASSSSGTSGSDVTTTSSMIRKRRHCIVAIIVFVIIVMLIAAIVPAIVLSNIGETGRDVHRKFDLSLKILSINYTTAFEDKNSDEFLWFKAAFCDAIEAKAIKELTQQTFVGCDISNLSKGSLIVRFLVFFKMSAKQAVLSHTEVKVALGLTPTQEQQVTVTLGRFEINVTSVVVLEDDVVNTQDNIIPGKISFNGTCKSNDRCMASLARCVSGVCACAIDKYYNATSNACLSIDCGVVPMVANAATSMNSSSFGDHFNITCDTGYEINTNKTSTTVTCSQHGSWGEKLQCNPIRCPTFVSGANTTIQNNSNATNTSLGALIKLECVRGFTLTGANEVSCQADKTWSSAPQCVPVVCPLFTFPNHTSVAWQSRNVSANGKYYVDDVIRFVCYEGMDINGDSNVTCLPNGTWSAYPTCKVIQCGNFTFPNHSIKVENYSRNYKEVLKIQCKDGYEMNGNESSVVCQANRTWSKGLECLPVKCPVFILPSNTTSNESGANRTFGDVISYTCKVGFEMTGNESSVRCQANKTWSQGSECRPVETGRDVHRQFDLSLKIQSINYTSALEDKNSDEFLRFKAEFCDAIEAKAIQELTQQTLVGCDISNLSKGSVIVRFSVFFKMSTKQAVLSHPEVKIALGLAPTQEQQVIVTLGRFEINVASVVVVLDVDVVNTQDNIIPDKISFNGTCKSNDRCMTLLARCVSGVCACASDKYYNATSNACLPIDCGEVPMVANAATSENSSSFGDHFNITCDTGYEIEANKTSTKVTCSQHGSWGDILRCNPIRCPNFVPVANTTIQSNSNATNTSLGAVIKLECVRGFKLTGANEVKCQPDKTWSSAPQCVPVVCPLFTFPDHTSVAWQSRNVSSNGEYYVDDVIRLVCNEGMDINGDSNVTCLPNETWSAHPTCKVIQCGNFTFPNHSNKVENYSRNYKDVLKIQCKDGYEMNGNESSVVCQANKTWSKGLECLPVKCPELDLTPNSTSNESRINRTFGDVLSYTCQSGFELTGNESSVKCQANKTWSQGSECRPVKCITFQLPPNTTSNDKLTDRTLGESVSYKCNEGLEINGNESTVKCLANKTWSKGSECLPVMCPELNLPPNTTSIESRVNKTFGDVITYTCQVGFELTGNESSVKCQANKTWTKGSDCQIVRCPEFFLLQNSTSNASRINRTYGDVVSYTCKAGFEINGNESSVRCQANKTWSQGSECRPVRCPEFTLPANSIFNGSRLNRTLGEVIAYNCQSGYEMVGNDSSVACQANKTWSRGLDCLPVQCPDASLPSYSTSNAILKNRTYGETITYSCQAGYELNGNISSIVCQANRTWTSGSSCEPVQCQLFKSPNNSVPGKPITENSNFTYGTNISFSCIEGYEGGSIVTCLANKSWSSAEICTPKRCDAYATPANATVIGNIRPDNFTFGDTLNITCNPGYLSNNKTVVTVSCTSNGTWGPIVKCEPRTCPNFTIPGNTSIGSQVLFGRVNGETINVTCNHGFNQVGNKEVMCREDGTWSPSLVVFSVPV